jgi:hypothetical protein
MPWKCPACRTSITRDGAEPKPNRVYRCHVCHLELMLDESTHTRIVASVSVANIRRLTDAEP